MFRSERVTGVCEKNAHRTKWTASISAPSTPKFNVGAQPGGGLCACEINAHLCAAMPALLLHNIDFGGAGGMSVLAHIWVGWAFISQTPGRRFHNFAILNAFQSVLEQSERARSPSGPARAPSGRARPPSWLGWRGGGMCGVKGGTRTQLGPN